MKILVAIDGSGFSRLAVQQAADLAEAKGAEILLLTVSSVVNMGSYAAVAYVPDSTWEVPSKSQALEILEEAEAMLHARGLTARKLHRVGGISDTILEVADHERVDLIVVGSHGRTGLTRFLLGSVSSQVATHAHCSVLVAKHPTALAAGAQTTAQAAVE